MILALFFTIGFTIFTVLINFLPEIYFNIPFFSVDSLANVIASVAYFMPVGFIMSMMAASLSLDVWHFVYRLMKRYIPFIR